MTLNDLFIHWKALYYSPVIKGLLVIMASLSPTRPILKNPCLFASYSSEDPTFDLCRGHLIRRKGGNKEAPQRSGTILFLKPSACRVGILLVRSPRFDRIAVTPERRIDLGDDVHAGWHSPTVEWPEMDCFSELIADVL